MTFSTAYIISFDWNTLVNEFGKAEINILSLEKFEIKRGSDLHKVKVVNVIVWLNSEHLPQNKLLKKHFKPW